MPTYNYVCPKCGCEQEITKPMSESQRAELCDAPDEDGNPCEGRLERNFNGQGSTFQLKGQGWTGNAVARKGRR
jgi:predicted nucleic acid-binding Zn ribbon protein